MFLDGFTKRFKFTIDSSLVDATLTDFPVMIRIAADAGIVGSNLTEIFDELGSEDKKIAVTTEDGETQCYVEIELWDDTSEVAILHAKIPSISSSADTIFFLYYDANANDNTTYVGDTGDAAAQNVWDSDFEGVWHFAQDPTGTSLDSTSNEKNLTDGGTVSAFTMAQGDPGVNFATGYLTRAGFNILDLTTEAIIIPDSFLATDEGKNTVVFPGANHGIIQVRGDGANAGKASFYVDTGTYYYSTTVLAADTQYYLGGKYEEADTQATLFVNDAKEIDENVNSSLPGFSGALGIGAQVYGGPYRYYDGKIGEVRFSSIARADAWLKATYYTLFDTLLTASTSENWLPGYKYRIKAEVDASLIDATLTDFPVLLRIAEDAGISLKDARRVFEAMEPPRVPEGTFTGEDADPWDAVWWRPISAATGENYIDSNEGRLKILTGESGNHFVQSYAKLSGDFDIQIDFTNITGQVDSDQQMGLVFTDALNSNAAKWCAMTRRYQTAQAKYNFRYDDAGANDGSSTENTSDNAGKLRLVRSGSTISGYYWDGSAWAQVGTSQTWVSDDCFFGLYAYRAGTTKTSDYLFDFDNFLVNSGRVIWPEGADPYRKKIAVTTADGLTQCPVEIERWDIAEKIILLHTKLPSVDDTTDTVFYLYFDPDADDNTDYVGDTGDAAAQAVWDSNFEAVYHLAQDPSGGAGAILDSTSNGNDGTSAGTMTTADLVDGLKGAKGLDFDGSNDLISIGSAAVIDDLAPFFIESVFNADTFGGGGFGRIFEKADTGSDGIGIYLGDTDDDIHLMVRADTTDGHWSGPASGIVVETDYYFAVHFDRSDAPAGCTDPVFHLNGTKPAITEVTTPAGSWESDAAASGIIANRADADRAFNGIISELRISDTDRGDAWAKATYHTLFDTLVTVYGVETREFKKRIKFTIDSDLIDAELTDFPIALPLSAAAGTGAEDLAAIFAELKYPASDAFLQPAGESFDTTRWEIMGQAGNVSMLGDALQCYADSGDTAGERQGVLSKFKLDYTEDFDIRVDFEVTAGPATNYWGALLEVYFWNQTGGSVGGAPAWDTAAQIQRAWATAEGHKITSNVVEDASWETADYDAVTATKGRLRLTFDASDPSFTAYYDVGAGWVALSEFVLTNVDATDALVCLAAVCGGSSPTVTVEYKNFRVYAGKVVWPDGEPNRKKIKVTLDDTTTQCYVEIEHLDVDGQVGMLHAKIPTIASDADTDIYLHFDADQPDNDDYVGDTGDAVAQGVWDDDFEAVLHMNWDPTGALGLMKDSTVNDNTISSEGTMITEDLVDGLKGARALDFDGSNDCLRIANDAGLSPSGGLHTVEAILETTKDYSAQQSRVYSDYGADTNNLVSLGINTDNKLLTYYRDGDGDTLQSAGQGAAMNDGAFHHAVWVRTSGGIASSYLDGVFLEELINASVGTIATSDGRNVNVSGWDSGSGTVGWWNGMIGEIRVSSAARSAAWIKATYHTLFDTIGAWDSTVEGPNLGTWVYRRKFTISAAKISAELTDFPIALSIDASCGLGADDLSAMFTRIVAADKKKIAVTDRDKITQLYAEIENWDSDNSKALLHVKIPKIALGKDYEVYLYYDSAQDENTQKVGVAGEAVVNYVWDDNFLEVIHMYDGTTLKSSIDGTTLTIAGSLAEVDGPNGGNALQANDDGDYIDYPSLAFTNNFTIEAQAYIDAGGPNPGYDMIMGEERTISLMAHHTSGTYWGLYLGDNSSWDTYKPSNSALSEATWYNLAAVYNAGAYNYYKNGAADGSGSGTSRSITSTFNIFGRENAPSALYYFHGKMAEFRISTGSRSAAWIEATYNALFDILGTWAAEEALGAATPDVNVSVGAAAIAYAAQTILSISVGVLANAAAIAYAVPSAVEGVGADAGPAQIVYAAPASGITQNLHAIGIMSKPIVSTKGPSANVTAKQPGATVTGKGPSANVTAKGE